MSISATVLSSVTDTPRIDFSLAEQIEYKAIIPLTLPLANVGLTGKQSLPLLLSRMNVSGSIYLTLAIAVERYATVCHPYFRVSRLTAFIDYLSYHSDKKESVGGRKERGDKLKPQGMTKG